MFNSLALNVILLLSIGIISIGNAQLGVKGGHYQQYQQQSHSPYSQPANQTGYCYKRVPYHQAGSQIHRNGSHPESGYDQRTRPHWNDTYHHEWVTILDCCDGYQKNPRTNSCEVAHCEGNCFGGRCIGEVCTCDPSWLPIDGVCKPICRQACGPNAYCFSPDVCECLFGWEKSQWGDCKPVCPGGCINGDCVAPKTCRCKPGYTLNEVTRHCIPDCEEGCHNNGQCVAPGVCRCNPGYQDPDGLGRRCEPYCGRNNCGEGGECHSPGVCRCRAGYTKNPYSEVCEPHCSRRCPPNTRCAAPETCVCLYGPYRQDLTQCLSRERQTPSEGGVGGNVQLPNHDCDRPCINGVCMGFNICSCNDGYIPDPHDITRTRCIESCPGGCPNGICSGPNLCLCKPGYVKDRSVKGSQRCIPMNNY